jgi:hypothetical protein
MTLTKHRLVKTLTSLLAGLLDQALSAPQYRLGFLGILQDRYIPDLPSVSSGQGESICSSWIAAACDLSSTSTHPDMLIDSLLAMSLALVGKEREQNELSMAGVKHYSRALSQLRAGLRIGSLAVDQADDNLVTCLCCAMYEVGFRLFLRDSPAKSTDIGKSITFCFTPPSPGSRRLAGRAWGGERTVIY